MADEPVLRCAAERAAERPFFLASPVLTYARAEGLDDIGLAAELGCDVASLPALLLCRRPTGEGRVFRAEVEAIARRFGVSAARLGQILRTADALAAFERAGSDQHGGLLAAARDREAPAPQPAGDPANRPEPDSPGD